MLERGRWAYGVLDPELLAGTDVARLGDGGLEAAEGLAVQSLFSPKPSASRLPSNQPPHSSSRLRSRTWALVTTISTSPRAALISSLNLPQTPGRRPRRLFSARGARKFLTVSPEAPAFFCNSTTMALLSAEDRVGASRMVTSFASFCSRLPRAARPLAVGSREEVLTAAVYYTTRQGKMAQVSSCLFQVTCLAIGSSSAAGTRCP